MEIKRIARFVGCFQLQAFCFRAEQVAFRKWVGSRFGGNDKFPVGKIHLEFLHTEHDRHTDDRWQFKFAIETVGFGMPGPAVDDVKRYIGPCHVSDAQGVCQSIVSFFNTTDTANADILIQYA